MAQLSDDCFAFGGALQQLNAALDDLTAKLKPLAAIERRQLSACNGCILAEPLMAPTAVPGFRNSAVDGYAVRFSDLKAGEATALPVSLRVPAGMLDIPPLPIGHAARIFTGAPMPNGADTVFMQEDVQVAEGRVILPPGLKLGANCREAGEDFAPGVLVLEAGRRLDARAMAAAAALGVRDLPVFRPLRVAVFSTGDELRAASFEGVLPPGAIRDANRPMLFSLLARRGILATDLGILPDSREAIAEALRRAAEHHDVLLTSGGVSTGEEDHVRAAVEQAGRLDFWRLAIKPGRPIAMGRLENAVLMGMPGNPAAVFVTFARFVGPVLDMLGGGQPTRPFSRAVIADFRYRKKGGRREYVRVSLHMENDAVIARRFPRDGAALISSLLQSDGLVELIEDRLTVEPGEPVPFFSYADLLL